MAVGCAEQLGVFVVAGGEAVVVDDLVLRFASGHDVVVAILELDERLLDGLAVAGPVAFVVDVHVSHVIDFVVAEHHVAAGLADCTEVVYEGELRHLAFLGAVEGCGALGQFAGRQEGGGGEVLVGNRDGAVHVGQVEVAPVDGDEVAGLAQHLLVLAAALDVLASILGDDIRHGGLAVVVNGHLGCRAEVELHVVLLLVVAAHLIGDVVDGGGHLLHVVHEEGCGEDEVEVNRSALEGVVGTGGQDVAGLLICQLLARDIDIETYVSQGAARGVVHVVGDEVLPFVQHSLVCLGELIDDVLHPGIADVDHATAIDIGLADIVVRIDEGEVLGQVLCRQGNEAADVVVTSRSRPVGKDIGVLLLAAEGTCSCLPRRVVEALTRPGCTAGGRCLDLSFPRTFVGHASTGDGLVAGMEAEVVLVEAEVSQSTALAVVHMVGNDVVALYERCPCCTRQMHLDVLVPLLFRHLGNLNAVDVQFALIVVRIDDPEVALQVIGREGNVSADVAVRVVARPV